jgi:hypothetical protein
MLFAYVVYRRPHGAALRSSRQAAVDARDRHGARRRDMLVPDKRGPLVSGHAAGPPEGCCGSVVHAAALGRARAGSPLTVRNSWNGTWHPCARSAFSRGL